MDEGIVFLALVCFGLGLVWIGIEHMGGKGNGNY